MLTNPNNLDLSALPEWMIKFLNKYDIEVKTIDENMNVNCEKCSACKACIMCIMCIMCNVCDWCIRCGECANCVPAKGVVVDAQFIIDNPGENIEIGETFYMPLAKQSKEKI